MSNYEIYTDGSAKKQWGSWAYILTQNGKTLHEAYGRARKTNSNRMEFQAVIEALQAVPTGASVILFCDCRVLLDKIPFFPELATAGWKNCDRLIANHDLYSRIYELLQSRNVNWKWVRAHSGNVLNERCDELCVQARGG